MFWVFWLIKGKKYADKLPHPFICIQTRRFRTRLLEIGGNEAHEL